MPGKRLTPAEHALVVLSVRKENIPTARRLAEGYLFFVDTDEEADWLDKLMRREGLFDAAVEMLPDATIRTDVNEPAYAALGIVNEPGPEPKPTRPFGVPRASVHMGSVHDAVALGIPVPDGFDAYEYDEFAHFSGEGVRFWPRWFYRVLVWINARRHGETHNCPACRRARAFSEGDTWREL